MSLAVKLIQKGASALFSASGVKTAQTVIDNKPLLTMAKEAAKELGEVVKLRLKPDISIPIRPSTIDNVKPDFAIKYTDLDNDIVKGEIGNMALRLEKKYASQVSEAREKFSKMFPGKKVDVRSKSAASIYSKIVKNVKEKELTLTKDTDVESFLTDGVAGRLTLESLSRKDVLDVIKNFNVDGKYLTAKEKKFLKRYFGGDAKLSKAQKKVAEKYAQDIKLQLAEKQSEEAYNSVILSMMKDALDRKVVTMEQLSKMDVNPKLLETLKNNPDKIASLHVPRFCNYRGPDGLAYFSDNQIRNIKRLQVETGEKYTLDHTSNKINLSRYNISELPADAKKGIKPGGYTTTQMNFYLSDGSRAELQIRGEGCKIAPKSNEKITFGEIEHVNYDGNQGKGTINKTFEPFQKAKAEMSKSEELKSKHTRYLQKCYNYDRSVEVGFKDKKPGLAKGLSKLMSRENMTKLHYVDEAIQKEKMQSFKPYVEFEKIA